MPGPKNRLLATLGLALVPLLAAGCLVFSCGDGRSHRPNILLITVDTLRPDHLSTYGFKKKKTPRIDALAAEGTLFEFAHTDVTWTTPAMVSTMTGTYPVRHGFRSYYDVVGDETTTIALLLKEAGYQTGAVVAAYPLSSVFGLDRGFDTYDERFTRAMMHEPAASDGRAEGKPGSTEKEEKDARLRKVVDVSWRPDPEVTEAALARLTEMNASEGPFFLWVHYFGPHSHLEPMLTGKENEKRHVRTYAAKVVEADAEVGRLLDYLSEGGIGDKTFVILHSDHGESLGERDFVGHGRYLFENTLRVPLVLRWPGRIPAGKRIGALAGNIDIAPTILEAAGLDAGDLTLDGRSLFRLLEGEEAIHDEMYCETFLPSHSGFSTPAGTGDGTFFDVGIGMRGVLRPPWKYVLREAHPFFDREGEKITPEIAYMLALGSLYDLADDPDEKTSLMAQQKLMALSLRESLERFARLGDDRDEPRAVEGRDEHLEKLKSLGYVQ